jgi:hypothetical protein
LLLLLLLLRLRLLLLLLLVREATRCAPEPEARKTGSAENFHHLHE